jgi:hypothetical protein
MTISKQINQTIAKTKPDAKEKQTRKRPGTLRHKHLIVWRHGESIFYAKAGLSYWHEQVELRDDLYFLYDPAYTPKLLGMMKNYMKQIHASGRGIADEIELVVGNWWRIRNKKFESMFHGIIRSIPDTPEFGFFYIYRSELSAEIGGKLKLEMELRKTDSERERPKPLKPIFL